jgi:hypothetical protein|tara:strand:+ start:115 stop:342 length:228 start_codon:yes stop_codon:yes gene_type:complete
MEINNLGGNKAIVSLATRKFYFSYNTLILISDVNNIYATKEKYSRTTSKHLNLFLDNLKPNFYLSEISLKALAPQ